MGGLTVSRRFVRMAVSAGLIGALLPMTAFVEQVTAVQTRTWTGGGGGQLWSDPGNWSGGVAPAAGDNLVFPALNVNKQLTNDYPQGTLFGSITVDDNYFMTGSGIQPTSVDVTGTTGQAGLSFGTTGSPPSIPPAGGLIVPVGGSLTVSVAAGASLYTQTPNQLGNNATFVYDVDGVVQAINMGFITGTNPHINKTGTGTLGVRSVYSPTNTLLPLTVQAGTLSFDDNTSFLVDITQTGGTVTNTNNAFISSYNGTGGTFSPKVGSFNTRSDAPYTGQVNINAGSTFQYNIDSSGGVANISAANNVTLGGALQVNSPDYIPFAGQVFTLLSVAAGKTVTGTFSNTPGNTVIVNGVTFDIDYTSGTENNDITMTAQGTAYVWDGGGAGDTHWTNGANWSTLNPDGTVNQADAVVPGDGTATLRFPCAALTPNNDFAAGTAFKDLVLTGGGCDITGNKFKLNGNITYFGGSGTNTITAGVELVGGGTIQNAGSGAQLNFGGEVAADGGTINVTGQGNTYFHGGVVNDAEGSLLTGQLNLVGPQGFTAIDTVAATIAGPVTSNGRGLQLGGASAASIPNAQLIVHGAPPPQQQNPFIGGIGSVKGLTQDGGTLSPSSNAGKGTVTSNGDVTLSGSSMYVPDLDGPGFVAGTDYDQLIVAPTFSLTLSGASLQATSMNTAPPLGKIFTIVDNQGPNAVNGTFAGLPEGAIVPWSSSTFNAATKALPLTISYVGGDGNDITLTIGGKIWDGGGGVDHNWTTAANWNPDAVPVAGDSLTFPAGPAQKAANNDFPAGTAFGSILFGTSGYNLTGNSFTLNGNITDTNTAATNTVNLPISIAGTSTFRAEAGGTLALGPLAVVTIGAGHTVTLGGQGAVTFVGGSDLAGGTLVINKEMNALQTLPALPNITNPVVVNGGTVFLTGDVPAGFAIHGPGTVSGDVAVTVGPITADGFIGQPSNLIGSFSPGSSQKRIYNTGSLDMEFGSSLNITVIGNTPGTDQDEIIVNGTVTVHGSLGIDYGGGPIPASELGIPIVIISNDGTDPVVGNFIGFAEGASIAYDGQNFARISYAGGDGNDVTITYDNDKTWDGEAEPGSSNWTTATNWQGDVAPVSNAPQLQSLTFRPYGFVGGPFIATDDYAAGSKFEQLRVTTGDYTLTGVNSLLLNTGVFAENPFGGSFSGNVTYNIPTSFVGSNGTFSQAGGGTMIVQSAITLGGGSLTLAGAGAFSDLDDVTNGDLIVATQGGSLTTLAGTLPALNGSVIVNAGKLLLTGVLANSDLVVNGGRATGNGSARGITTTGGTLAPGDTGTAILSSAVGASLGGTGTYEVQLNGTTPGSQHDQLAVTGAVSVGGALDVTVTGSPATGTQYTIISNDASDAVTGTFTGLAEGASFTANGTSFTISYAGGSNNNDVVLTVAGATVSLNTAAVALAEGNTGSNTSAGLTVQLSSAQPTDVIVHVKATDGTGTAGTDTSALDQDLTIPMTQTSVAVPFTITGDDTVEGNETVDVTLTIVSGATVAPPSVATVTINNDDAAPSVTIDKSGSQADPTSTSPIQFTVVFSESVTGFATGDVTLAGTAGATTATVTGSGANYTVDVTGMSADGTVIASINAGVATDSGANGNTASTSTDNTVDWIQPVDSTPPSVTINQGSGQADPTATAPIVFDVVFSETVTGFDGADITLGGTAGATTANVSGSGTTYTVSVTGMTTDGTVTASVNAGGAIDGAANPNTASTSTDNTVTWSTTPVTTSTTTTTTTTTPGSTTTTTPGATTTTTPGTVPPPGPGGIVINTPGGQVSLEVVSGGALQTFTWGPLSVPPPDGYIMPFGELSFTASAAPAGGLVVLKMVLPMSPAAYFKLAGPAWQNFVFNGETGSQIIGNTIVLTIRDNGRGDTNPAAGLIADPSAPAIPAPDLPATGTDSIAYIQLALMAVGTGVLVLVSRRRRRRRAVAAN